MYWIGKNRVTKPDPITAMFIKTEFTDTCWLFNGSKSRAGYGTIKHNTKVYFAHRFIYETFFGPIEKELVCCHKCDVRNCINPAHIFIGTRTDNQNDMKKKGRQARGSNNGTSKLVESDILIIKKLYADGMHQKDIAKNYSVSQTVISKIIIGKTWTHVNL